jgi:ADP-heptose:LPS heptosyltransferase
MFWLGVPRVEIPRAKLVAVPLQDGPVGTYAALHPFASAPEKAWPVDRFIAVGRHLRDHSGLEPVVLAGPVDDASPFEEFRVYRNAPLAAVKSVLAGAQLFVGNDSGPAHIAAAFGVPVVALFGPSDPVTWAPWRTEAQVLTSPEAMAGIGVEQVISAADALRVRA